MVFTSVMKMVVCRPKNQPSRHKMMENHACATSEVEALLALFGRFSLLFKI